MGSLLVVATAAALAVQPLGVVGEHVFAVPTHPALVRAGWLAFVTHVEEPERRCEVVVVRVGAADAERGPRTELTMPCDPDQGFVNLLPAADGVTPEVVALAPTGLERLHPAPRTLLVPTPTFVVLPPRDPVRGPALWQPAPPGAEPGRAPLAVLVPGTREVTLWERPPAATASEGAADVAAAPAFQLRARYPVSVEASLNVQEGRDALHADYHLLAHLRMPKLALGALAPGAPDGMLAAIENEVWGTWPRGSDAAARAFHHRLEPFPASDADERRLTTVRGNRLGDLDGDGQLDLALTASRGGITKLRSRLALWRGPLAETLRGPPTRVLARDGAAIGTELVDVDRDGALEFVRPTIEVSVAAFVRVLLFQEIAVRYDLVEAFAPLAEGEDEPRPFCSFTRTMPVDLSGLAGRAGPVFDVRGDFDGDGVLDAVTGDPTDGYAIHAGRQTDAWCTDDEPLARLPEDVTAVLDVVDVGADGSSEVVVAARRAPGSHVEAVLVGYPARR